MEYALAAEYRGKDYAAEALRKIVDYGFPSLDLSVIAAWVRSFKTGSVRKSDALCYSILKEEWEALRGSYQ